MKAIALTEFVLVIGVLISAGIIVFQLITIFLAQQKLSKEEIVYSFAKDVSLIVDKSFSTTGTTNFVYTPVIQRYAVEIKNSTIFIFDKTSKTSTTFSKSFIIVDNKFEDCKKIYFLKENDKIAIFCKCLETGESCLDSLICCSGYCNSSKKCDEPPVCPENRKCIGASPSEAPPDSLGTPCCPIDKPICSEKHCCPLEKPKWCENPKNGEARCMDEDEYEQNCQKETFILLFLQVNGNVPNFESLTENAKNRWVTISPLNNCPQTVKKIAVSDKVCPVDECDALEDIKKCASDWGYSGSYTRVIGVKDGNYICEDGVMGYTLLYDNAVVVVDQDLGNVMSHELGHTFGLCDEGYGNTFCSHCSSGICPCGGGVCICGSSSCCPNKPELNSLMCSSDPCNRGCSYSNRFASTSYSHLEVELNEFCQ